jgi:hypothetical protein
MFNKDSDTPDKNSHKLSPPAEGADEDTPQSIRRENDDDDDNNNTSDDGTERTVNHNNNVVTLLAVAKANNGENKKQAGRLEDGRLIDPKNTLQSFPIPERIPQRKQRKEQTEETPEDEVVNCRSPAVNPSPLPTNLHTTTHPPTSQGQPSRSTTTTTTTAIMGCSTVKTTCTMCRRYLSIQCQLLLMRNPPKQETLSLHSSSSHSSKSSGSLHCLGPFYL